MKLSTGVLFLSDQCKIGVRAVHQDSARQISTRQAAELLILQVVVLLVGMTSSFSSCCQKQAFGSLPTRTTAEGCLRAQSEGQRQTKRRVVPSTQNVLSKEEVKKEEKVVTA